MLKSVNRQRLLGIKRKTMLPQLTMEPRDLASGSMNQARIMVRLELTLPKAMARMR